MVVSLKVTRYIEIAIDICSSIHKFQDRHSVTKHLWGARTAVAETVRQSFIQGLEEKLNMLVGKDAIGRWRWNAFETPNK